MRRGVFISFEGSEGCGKSTQIALLSARCAAQGMDILRTREPGGTPIGERIRELLQHDQAGDAMTPEAELLLFAASRAQLVRQMIRPALEQGMTVIADRFFDSTTVYQGVARQIEPEAVRFVNAFAIGGCLPDVTFLMDLDLSTANARIAARPKARADRMEEQPAEFYEAVRDGYLRLAEREPGRICVMDAAQPVETIAAAIWSHLQSRFHGLLPKQAIEFLARAESNGRLAHAYLITGQPGSGKRSLALDFAAMLQRVAPESVLDHPDVYIAEPESKSRRIVIEQIRALENGLQMRSTRGGRKIGIIFDADRLQPQASNAFLKTLEEPPAHSLLLLVTAQPELLLDTIISRCILLPLAPAARTTRTEPENHLLAALARYAQSSSAGLAAVYGLARIFSVQLQAVREKIVAEHAAEMKRDEIHYKQTSEAGKWLEEREDHFKALTEARYVQARFTLVDVMMQWWTDALRQQAGVDQLDLPEARGVTSVLAERLSPADLLRRLRAIEDLRENLNRNIQEALAVEVAFLKAFGN